MSKIHYYQTGWWVYRNENGEEIASISIDQKGLFNIKYTKNYLFLLNKYSFLEKEFKSLEECEKHIENLPSEEELFEIIAILVAETTRNIGFTDTKGNVKLFKNLLDEDALAKTINALKLKEQ